MVFRHGHLEQEPLGSGVEPVRHAPGVIGRHLSQPGRGGRRVDGLLSTRRLVMRVRRGLVDLANVGGIAIGAHRRVLGHPLDLDDALLRLSGPLINRPRDVPSCGAASRTSQDQPGGNNDQGMRGHGSLLSLGKMYRKERTTKTTRGRSNLGLCLATT